MPLLRLALHAGLFAMVLGSESALAQSRSKKANGDDMRDRVTLMSGKEVYGRVVSCFATNELLVLQGGARKRIPRKEVRDVHTIHDEMESFFAMRTKIGDKQRRREFLIDWAKSHQLPGMARLQALDVLRNFPGSAVAHRYLGHKLRGKGEKARWLWPLGDRFVSRTEMRSRSAKWGTAPELTSEHFALKTTVGTALAVDVLFDLERFYLFYRATFGKALGIREVLQPIRVQVWSNVGDFPPISARPIAYYDLKSDACASYFAADAERPEELFAITTQALLYRTLVGGRGVNPRHVCAWAEIGVGQWMEDAFGGKPGRALPRDKPILDTRVASGMAMARPQLKTVTHWPYILFYEKSRRAPMRWDATRTAVHFLMSEKPDKKRRARFMDYLQRAFKKGLGDSSRAFDSAMGEKVETLQPKFRRWVQVRTN